MAAPLSKEHKCPFCHRTGETVGYRKSIVFVHEKRINQHQKSYIYDGCIIGYPWIREVAGNVTIIGEGIAKVVK